MDLLNKVQALLIDHANANGLVLADEFGTRDNFAKFVISFTIKNLTECGMSLPQAFDTVMGDGAYRKLADDVWTTLQPQ
tara:strand:- start:3249 stop:3485 length:237 start_codon:yes stop_codon:yes gene_type:complete